MPLKKADGRRFVEMELDLPGRPEDIWHALATGPGYAAWFVPTTVEQRKDSTIVFDFGDGNRSTGVITAWEPPRRIVFEEHGWSGEAPPVATEITIEARSGGTCKMRMVHSLFTERDDWDQELEGFESGWPGFFEVLRLYLRHHAGQHAASSRVNGNFQGSHREGWLALQDALAVGGVQIGELFDTSPVGAPRLVGTVDAIRDGEQDSGLRLHLTEPAPGVALFDSYHWGGKTMVPVSLYFYGDDAEATLAREKPKWEAWMAEHFPA